MERTVRNMEELAEVARETLEMAEKAESSAAAVVGLRGDLGSGKTAFVKELAKILGVEETVTSPTFVILKLYGTRHPRFKRLVHIDAYRLDSADELVAIGWKDLVADPGSLIAIEWPEKVSEGIPADSLMLDFKFVDDLTRRIEIKE